jgi:PhnB protein
MQISPHIVVPDASRAAEWYRTVLGAEEESRIALPDGKLMSVVLRVGDSVLHLSDEFPDMGVLSPLSIGGTAVVLSLTTDDVDALWQRALDGGADVRQTLGDTFWGERHGQITDPFGHRWNLAQHVRDVPPDEVAREAAKAFGY